MRYSTSLALHGRGLGFESKPQNTGTISNKSMWGSTPGSWARGSAVLQMFTSALLPLWAPAFSLSTSAVCSCPWLTPFWLFSSLFECLPLCFSVVRGSWPILSPGCVCLAVAQPAANALGQVLTLFPVMCDCPVGFSGDSCGSLCVG